MRLKADNGFTLIEILLVLTIIGVLLAVIVPRAHRAQVETRYTIVRQTGTEISTWALEWIERSQESQTNRDTCSKASYLNSLTNSYVGDNTQYNWYLNNNKVPNPLPNCRQDQIQTTVASLMPPEFQPKNPFNGLSYFSAANSGGNTWTPGDLYLGSQDDGNFTYYYFIYHGTDASSESTWHGGMGNAQPPLSPPLANLRNGIYVTRLRSEP